MQTITRDELTRRMAERALTLLEALPERYYREGHLPGALNLPHTEVEARAGELLPDKQTPVVVYCASESCRNSHTAAAWLQRLGYAHVYVYLEGKQGWQAAGLPLEVPAASEPATSP